MASRRAKKEQMRSISSLARGSCARTSPAYDAMYVALAEALHAPIVTCDAPLAKAPGHRVRIEVIE